MGVWRPRFVFPGSRAGAIGLLVAGALFPTLWAVSDLRDGRTLPLTATSFGYWKLFVCWPRRNARNQADDIGAALDEWLHPGA